MRSYLFILASSLFCLSTGCSSDQTQTGESESEFGGVYAQVKSGMSKEDVQKLLGEPDRIVECSNANGTEAIEGQIYKRDGKAYLVCIDDQVVQRKSEVKRANLDSLFPAIRPPDVRGDWTNATDKLPIGDNPVWAYAPAPKQGESHYELTLYDPEKRVWTFEPGRRRPDEPQTYFEKWGDSYRCAIEASVNRSSLEDLWKFWFAVEPGVPLEEWQLPEWAVRKQLRKKFLDEMEEYLAK